MPNHAALFPRNFKKQYPNAVSGEGSWITAADGRKYLDVAGQAAVVNIGHGVTSVARAMAEQASQLAFAHSSQFHTAASEKLAARLLALAPESMRRGGRVYFCSGGSEANETAIKLARQYFLECGQPERFRVVSRRQSYHGSTLGAMAMSGNLARRSPYQPLLPEWGHIDPCFCRRCPLGMNFPECRLACAEELETLLRDDREKSIAAFIFEPVVGATLGAAVPPDGYVQQIAEICRRNGALLIADEVMTGMGRTGKPFAVDHWSIAPDMITFGKGAASGYAPLGGVIVGPRVVEAFERGSGAFQHGFTYQNHPVSMVAGNAVLDVLEEQKLFARVTDASRDLFAALEPLRQHPHVDDVRGLGLLAGIEFVKDKNTRAPFPREENISGKIFQAAMDEGVLTYPTQGCVDGVNGDHILLAPPFIISSEECHVAARAIAAAMEKLFTVR
ncbi:MAG TPA: aspartate aminotransferase family protein [Candidatus Angelobacter sp.]|nr:aspartate aminotransferase family protein [Candidatus Angelobacter sp.]